MVIIHRPPLHPLDRPLQIPLQIPLDRPLPNPLTIAARRISGAAVIFLTVLAGMVLSAPPASAHAVSGVGATNWQTFLTSVEPRLPGVELKSVENGSQIELINHGPEITVFGYEGEPYLRVGLGGVFINLNSPATYLNCSRKGCAVPAGVSASDRPQWQKLSSLDTVVWHDHRTHWMGNQPPPFVAAHPGQRHIESYWTVTMARGSTRIIAKGYYEWFPGPGAFPWVLITIVVLAAGLVMALTRSLRWLAALVGLVAAVDFGHALVVAWFWTGSGLYKGFQLMEGSSYEIPGWILAGAAVVMLCRRRELGLKFAAVVGASAALFTGCFDFTVFDRSHAPFDGPILFDRICVALCLGLGLCVLLGAIARLRRRYDDIEVSPPGTDALDLDSGVDEFDEVVA
ncbi:MAG: hypothetical protein ACRDZ8_09220 [Acidimicrobiales bacterium]